MTPPPIPVSVAGNTNNAEEFECKSSSARESIQESSEKSNTLESEGSDVTGLPKRKRRNSEVSCSSQSQTNERDKSNVTEAVAFRIPIDPELRYSDSFDRAMLGLRSKLNHS